jgi:hypothetical protein
MKFFFFLSFMELRSSYTCLQKSADSSAVICNIAVVPSSIRTQTKLTNMIHRRAEIRCITIGSNYFFRQVAHYITDKEGQHVLTHIKCGTFNQFP